MICLFHKWEGCKCKKCGKKREEGHIWETLSDKCVEKCRICGDERIIPHQFKKAENKCVEVCTHCGLERPVLHTFADEICVNCGAKKSDMGTKAYVDASDNIPDTDNCVEMAEWIDEILKNYEGQGSWQLIEPAIRIYSNFFLQFYSELKILDAVSSEDSNATISHYYGFPADICIREYCSRRFMNGDFDLENAERRFNNSSLQVRPGMVHPRVTRDFLARKLDSVLTESTASHPLKFAVCISDKQFCDSFINTVINTPELNKALPEFIYESVIEYAKSILK